MLTKKQVVDKLEKNKKKIKSFGVEEIFLVGSYATGSATENSDIDFVVEFDNGRGLFDDFVHLRQFLQDLFGKEIDLGEKHLIREELVPFIFGGEQVEARI